MNTFTKTIGALVIVLVLGFVYLFGVVNREKSSYGSVVIGNEYQSTTTIGMSGKNLIFTGSGVLGSIIISSSSAATLTVNDATSTIDAASTTKAFFISSPANGTYTFDLVLTRGLSLDLGSGFNGAYTITYRAQ